MIYALGSINLDLIARVPDLPLPGQTVGGGSFQSAPGGKGANQALAAKRAGAAVQMLGAVADDANAGPALELLEDAGVDLSTVERIEDDAVSTGVAMILVSEASGENQIAVVPGANGKVGAQTVEHLSAASGDMLLLQMEVPAAANRLALERAKEVGAISILNIAPYGDAAAELAQSADFTIANETEFDDLADALSLTGSDRRERAEDYAQKTGKNIVITLGAEGALALVGGKLHQAVSPKIEPVDTVGAGDTFCGAFAVALSEGMEIETALAFACAAGARACLTEGAQPSIPTRSEIEVLLNS